MSRKKRREAAKALAASQRDSKIYEPNSNPFPPGCDRVYPSSPMMPPKFHFFCRYPYDARAGEGRLHTASFYSAYAAKKFLEYLIGKAEPRWPNLHTFVTSTGVEVRCMAPCDKMHENEIEFALNHKYSKAEEVWILPEQERKSLAKFMRPWPDIEKPTMRASGLARIDRPSRVSTRPEGDFISVADICDEVGCEPREGRAALRKKNVQKPVWGWSFPQGSPELDNARTVIRKFAK